MTESSIEKWTQFFHMNNNEMVDKYQKGDAKVKVFTFDFSELIAFNPTIAQEYLDNPDVVMGHINDAVKEYPFASMKRAVAPEFRVRFEKFPSSTKIPIRNLRKDLLDTVVTVEGTVRNVSTVEPRLIIGAYECGRCHYFNYIDQNSIGKVTEPAFCEGAECAEETKKGIFTLRIKESTFDDYQRIKVQEGQEDLKGGEKPESIDINLSTDLTARATPGQHITVNGILRGSQKQTKEGKMVFFDLYMDAISIEFEENDFADIEITPEDEAAIVAAAKDPHIFENMIASIAPSIKGHDLVKLAITLQLFGGVRTTLPDGSPVRGDSHILLVGDPGIAKSYIVKYVINLAPRGQYASGKSASAAGLTATITKDEFDGQFTFEAGTLVLADNGIAAVDELDKMKAEDRSSLHEALEQQSISLAKATVHTVLKARCSLLAAANPKLGRFDKFTPIAQQIDLPPSLLSRLTRYLTLVCKFSKTNTAYTKFS
jgi:replicative DNA helicase Mcm